MLLAQALHRDGQIKNIGGNDMKRKKYEVYIYHVANEDEWCEYVLRTDDPREAIEKWVDISHDNPTMAAIDTTRREYAYKLIDYAYKNMEWLNDLCHKKRCPYTWAYINDGVGTKYQTGCDTFHETEINGEYYPDQIYPFCLG